MLLRQALQNLLGLIQEENKEFAWTRENYSFESFEQQTPVKIKFEPLIEHHQDVSNTDCQRWALFESAEAPRDHRQGRSLLIIKVPALLKKLLARVNLKEMFYALPDFKYLK